MQPSKIPFLISCVNFLYGGICRSHAESRKNDDKKSNLDPRPLIRYTWAYPAEWRNGRRARLKIVYLRYVGFDSTFGISLYVFLSTETA